MNLPGYSAKVFKLCELKEGDAAQIEFRIGDLEMDAFARLSGDRNPMHLDDSVARARGFDGRVVYGALLVAQLSRLIGMELPGRDSVWSGLQMQFIAPLYLGEAARLEAVVGHVSSATRSVELRVEVRAGTRLVARGKATAVVQDGA